jgi:integrase/recombinase XerD
MKKKTKSLQRRQSGAIVNLSGATTDEQLVRVWLARRPKTTRKAYEEDLRWWAARRVPGAGGWRGLRLTMIHDAVDQGELGSKASYARRVASLRSLLSWGHRVGYLPLNVGAVLEPVRVPNTLAERILEPDEVLRLLAAAHLAPRQGKRDHLFCRMLYVSGCRVSEICALDWEHVHAAPKGGATLTIHGKGEKTRHVWVTEGTYRELVQFGRPDVDRVAGAIFLSRFGTRLSVRDGERLVEAAAKRAKLGKVSPHWLRHGHATHALERGAPIHEVSADLGHSSVATTSRYLHARPGSGSAKYLGL